MSSDSRMPFVAHLRELRGCLVRALLGIFLFSGAALYWASELFALLILPLKRSGEAFTLIGTGPADAFIAKLNVAIVAGLILSLPFTFYQLWKFIAPGLHEHEKKLALPFVASATFAFISGAAFCYQVVFPFAFRFFLQEYQSIETEASLRINDYLSFVLKMILIFGTVFELPVLCFILARFGLVSSSWLLKKGRWIIVGSFVAAAVFTPPDVLSQLLLAAPLLLIYGICILVTYFWGTAEVSRHQDTSEQNEDLAL